MPRETRRFILGRSQRRRRVSVALGALFVVGSLTLSGAPTGASEVHTAVVSPPLSTPASSSALLRIADQLPATDHATFRSENAVEPEIDADSDADSDSDSEDIALAELVIAPENSDLSLPEEQLRLRILIRNSSGIELPEGTITVWIETQPLGAEPPEASHRSETGPLPESPVTIAEEDVSATRGGAEQTLSMNLAINELPADFSAAEPGVYEIHAYLRTADKAPDTEDAADSEAHAAPAEDSTEAAPDNPTADNTRTSDTALIATTRIVWRGSEITTPVPLTMVVPFVLPQAIDTMPTRDELGGLGSRFDALLTAAENSGATLAIDPRIIAAFRAYGADAPTSAQEFLTRLEKTELSHFLLQFADADPSAQAALGVDSLMRPTGLSFLEPSATTANGGAINGSGSARPPPGFDALTAWDQGFAAAWPAAGSVDAQTLGLLRRSDIDTVLISSDNASTVDGARFTLPSSNTNITAVVLNADLAEATRSSLSGSSGIERDAARARLATEFALSAQQQSTGQVLGFDRSAVADAENPSELIDWVSSLGWVVTTSLEAQPWGSGTLVPGSSSEERLEALRKADARSADILKLAPLLEHPEYLDHYQRMRMMWTFGTVFATDETAFAEMMTQERERDERYMRGVQIVSPANTQLVGTSTQLPVQLHNSLPFTASVLMHISPLSAAVNVSERLIGPTIVVAGGNSTVLVPVHSRVSSGKSALFMQLADVADTKRFVTATLPLALRTSLEAILLTGLSAFASLLLGLGIWRSVKQRRTRRNNPAVR